MLWMGWNSSAFLQVIDAWAKMAVCWGPGRTGELGQNNRGRWGISSWADQLQKLSIIQQWDVLQVPRDSESSAGWGPQRALVFFGGLDLLKIGESKICSPNFSRNVSFGKIGLGLALWLRIRQHRMSCRWVWVSNRSWSISSHDFNGHQLFRDCSFYQRKPGNLWSYWTKLRELRHPGHKRGECYTEKKTKSQGH